MFWDEEGEINRILLTVNKTTNKPKRCLLITWAPSSAWEGQGHDCHKGPKQWGKSRPTLAVAFKSYSPYMARHMKRIPLFVFKLNLYMNHTFVPNFYLELDMRSICFNISYFNYIWLTKSKEGQTIQFRQLNYCQTGMAKHVSKYFILE